MMAEPGVPPTDFFGQFPAAGTEGLIVRRPMPDLAALAYGYAEAADRLASTHKGRAPDDVILLPYLYLYRHACELTLKSAILRATYVRRVRGDADDSLQVTAVVERLKANLRHRLVALMDELDTHMLALGVERLPKSTRKVLQDLAALDPKGESFRYAEGLPDRQDYMDFTKLSVTVEDGYQVASCAVDILGEVEEYYRDLRGEAAQAEADLLAELMLESMPDWE